MTTHDDPAGKNLIAHGNCSWGSIHLDGSSELHHWDRETGIVRSVFTSPDGQRAEREEHFPSPLPMMEIDWEAIRSANEPEPPKSINPNFALDPLPDPSAITLGGLARRLGPAIRKACGATHRGPSERSKPR